MARTKKKAELTAEEKLAAALVPEAEQPYKVPDNWCWVRLGSVTEVASGGTPSTRVPEYYENGDIPWISPADLAGYTRRYISHGKKMITAAGLAGSSARLLPKDTVCLSTRAPIGYVAIAANELATNQGFKNFLPSALYESEYLYWYLKGNRSMLESKASGTTFLELSATAAKKIEMPLPPLPEQRRIVERVENLFAKLDEAESKLRAILAQSETRRTAILHDAFSGKLTKVWRDQQGSLLSDWESGRLIDLCEKIFDGPFGSHLKSIDYISSGIRVVRLENLRHLSFDDSKRSYVSKSKYAAIQSHTVYPTDVLMSTFISDNVKVCQLPSHIEFAVNKADCIGIRPRPGVNTTWLLYSLASNDTFLFLRSQIHGSTRPRVNSTQIKKIPLQVPPLTEQHEIVRRLDSLFSKQDTADARVKDVLTTITTLRQTILARALHGELGTNDPAEESSLELLKQLDD